MNYSMGEAAKATGKSKTTIHRAIKNGTISATRNEDGSLLPAKIATGPRRYPCNH